MKILIYTCITGDYDIIKEPTKKQGCDMMLFTDRPHKSAWWKTVIIRGEGTKTARHIKHNILEIIPGYDGYLWVDGSFRVQREMAPIAEKWLNEKDFVFMKHPQRNCWKAEARVCSDIHRAPAADLTRQVNYYKAEGLPENTGMIASGIMMFRPHKNVKEFFNIWWEQQQKFTYRDQISWPYSMSKAGKFRHEFRSYGEVTGLFGRTAHNKGRKNA